MNEKFVLFEDKNKNHLMEFKEKYPEVLNEKNLTQILQNAQNADKEFMQQFEEPATGERL